MQVKKIQRFQTEISVNGFHLEGLKELAGTIGVRIVRQTRSSRNHLVASDSYPVSQSMLDDDVPCKSSAFVF